MIAFVPPRRVRRALVLALLAVVGIGVGGMIRQARLEARILAADPQQLLQPGRDGDAARRAGGQVFAAQCAACHGPQGKGDRRLGVPDLTDREWLYGQGKVAEIEDITRFGIRSGHARARALATMPAYASARPYQAEPLPSLTPAQIEDLTQFVLMLDGRSRDAAAARRGATAYATWAGCWDCHRQDARGDNAVGAPSLADRVWLYGGDHDTIYRSIAYGRAGQSPAFLRRLTPLQIREVAAYVAGLSARFAGPSAHD